MAKKAATGKILSPDELKKQLGNLGADEKENAQDAKKLATTKKNAADMVKELKKLDLET